MSNVASAGAWGLLNPWILKCCTVEDCGKRRCPSLLSLLCASKVFVDELLLAFTIFTVDQVIDQTAELKDDTGIYDALGCHEEAQGPHFLCFVWHGLFKHLGCGLRFWVRKSFPENPV